MTFDDLSDKASEVIHDSAVLRVIANILIVPLILFMLAVMVFGLRKKSVS
jgi:ABC-type uncharacterized transport system involved in gliding motility auxiliary subunit